MHSGADLDKPVNGCDSRAASGRQYAIYARGQTENGLRSASGMFMGWA